MRTAHAAAPCKSPVMRSRSAWARLLLLLSATPSRAFTLQSALHGAACPAATASVATSEPRCSTAMVFGLPSPVGSLDPRAQSSKEILYHKGARIDFEWQRLGLTRRRVSGGVAVSAPVDDIWRVLTAYEQLPEIIPNILSNKVTRPPNGGNAIIDQTSLLSRRLKLQTEIGLEAIEEPDARRLTLRRLSGHGFLEFEDEVLILLDLASDSLDDPPPAPTLPNIDFLNTQPPDIEVIDDLDSADYFEE